MIIEADFYDYIQRSLRNLPCWRCWFLGSNLDKHSSLIYSSVSWISDDLSSNRAACISSLDINSFSSSPSSLNTLTSSDDPSSSSLIESSLVLVESSWSLLSWTLEWGMEEVVGAINICSPSSSDPFGQKPVSEGRVDSECIGDGTRCSVTVDGNLELILVAIALAISQKFDLITFHHKKQVFIQIKYILSFFCPVINEPQIIVFIRTNFLKLQLLLLAPQGIVKSEN